MIEFLRPLPVYHEPKLHIVTPTGGPVDKSETAKKERDRRGAERGFFQQLSMYYELEPGQEWERPALLLKGKHNATLDMLTTSCSLALSSVLEDFDTLDEVTAGLILEDPPLSFGVHDDRPNGCSTFLILIYHFK